MSTLFFTGYPGFLGSELLPRLLRRSPDANAVCLVQPKFAVLARERAKPLGDRVRIVEGDITSPIDAVADDVTEIWHLAAIYDLSVKRDVGMRVNVDGTRHMLDFAQQCRALQHFHYVSTCYVSGNLPVSFAKTISNAVSRSTTSTKRRSIWPRLKCARAQRRGRSTVPP